MANTTFELGRGAELRELLDDLLGLLLLHLLLEHGRRALDDLLRLLEAEARQRAHLLDDLDLGLGVKTRQLDVEELLLLRGGLGRRRSRGRGRGGDLHHAAAAAAALQIGVAQARALLEEVEEFLELKHVELADIITDLLDLFARRRRGHSSSARAPRGGRGQPPRRAQDGQHDATSLLLARSRETTLCELRDVLQLPAAARRRARASQGK